MTGFVVNLDLSAYFEDLRKFSSVFVNLSHCKIVGDVERHIKSVFKLDDNICLTASVYAKDFLVPTSEDVNILEQQQIKVFKVQKCDFYDRQIHKGHQVKTPCDQAALNLIHSNRSIDLSCRPKQRLKLNSNHARCTHDSSLHIIVARSEKEKCNQNLSSLSQIEEKEKQKNSKKKYGTENDILDMSFKNTKTKFYDNCFSGNKSLEEDVNSLDISRQLQDFSTSEFQKKVKKRKLCSNKNEEVALASSSWNTCVADIENLSNIKKHNKKTKERKNDYENPETVSDLCEYTNGQFTNNTIPSLQKKRKKDKKYSESNDSISINCEEGYDASTKQDIAPVVTKHKKKSKKSLEAYEESTNNLEEPEDENEYHSISISMSKNHVTQTVFDGMNGLADESSNFSFPTNEQNVNHGETYNNNVINNTSEFSDTKLKKKRVRKHNKRKKRERLQNLTGIGTLISCLNISNSNPLPKSEAAKHVYFTTDDKKEDINITTEAALDELPLPGKPQTEQEKSLLNGMPEDNEACGSLKKPKEWEEELLKLTSNKSKPIIFRRVTSSPLVNQESQPPSTSNLPPQQDLIKNLHGENAQNLSTSHDFHDPFNNQCIATRNTEKFVDTDLVTKISSETFHKSEEFQTLTIDTENIILENYPIIDKVVVNDLILFKILKMHDHEPGLSKTILAKVKATTNFPDEISLQIIGGCDECEYRLPESSNLNGANKEGFTLEFPWIEIFEPRLFYP